MRWEQPPPKLFVLAPDGCEFARWRLSLVLPRYAAVRLADTLVLANRKVSHVVDLTGGLDGADQALRDLLADVDRLGYSQRIIWCDRRQQLDISRQWWEYNHLPDPRTADSLAAVSEVR